MLKATRLIQIEDLSYRYEGSPQAALKGLSLNVDEGSLFGLLGPNGSGKTTLISILSGVLSASGSVVRIDGHDLNADLDSIQRFISLVPQDYAFYPRLTIDENLSFFANVQGISATDCRQRKAEALRVTGLEGNRYQRAERCSGGMKRRLNIAIGLLNRPRLLFLDEPTVGIDPQSRHFILEAVRSINKKGTTVIYTSHYMEEVEALCDEIGILDQGRLLVQGSLKTLLAPKRGGRKFKNLEERFIQLTKHALRD
jgi:ABC-2 type transport system ATP-binding protein